MRRVLVLLPAVPDPPDAGAKLRNLGLLRLLSRTHEVDAIAFGTPDEHVRLAPLVRRATVVPRPLRTNPDRLRDAFGTDLPDMAMRLWSAEFAAAVRSAVAAERYEAVQAEGIELAPYLGLVPPEQRIYDAHNAEFLLQRRASEAPGPLLARM
ncbi:MAG: hypothetical protein JOY61_14240, partial [Chloroflexi bacterium]|nr:hypothetical protein [Chloroflexota bacterium]